MYQKTFLPMRRPFLTSKGNAFEEKSLQSISTQISRASEMKNSSFFFNEIGIQIDFAEKVWSKLKHFFNDLPFFADCTFFQAVKKSRLSRNRMYENSELP